MNNDRLYIDDVLVDLGENVEITLVINSNLFRDISKITGNTTYTIRLPRTANNAAVFGVAGDVRSDDTFPTSYHKADYIRGGVPVITGGCAVLLSVSDMYEISISWGAFSPLADIINKGLTLNQLSGNETILFGASNKEWDYATAMSTGYYYASYDGYVHESSTEWVGKDSSWYNLGTENYTFSNGVVLTGAIGETIVLQSSTRAGTQYIVAPFKWGQIAFIDQVTGAADARAWCIVDEASRVILVCEDMTQLSGETLLAPVNAANIVINTTTGGTFSIQYRASTNTSVGYFGYGKDRYARLPVVNVSWVLDRIETDENIVFDFPLAAKAYIDALALPLVTAKANALTIGGVTRMSFALTYQLGQLFILAAANTLFSEQSGVVSQLTVARDAKVVVDIQGIYEWSYTNGATPQGSGSTTYGGTPQVVDDYSYFGNYIEVKIVHTDPDAEDTKIIVGNQNIDQNVMQHSYETDNNATFARIIAGYGEIELMQGDVVTFELKNKRGTLFDMFFYFSQMIITEDVDGDVPRGAQYPIIANLPDIKVTDFITTLCTLTGCVPLNKENGNKVSFGFINEPMNGTAKDWTTRIIPTHTNIEQAAETTYRLNEFARKNWYRWKDDSATIGNHDAYFEIHDDTLEDEHDVVTLPFAATNGNNIPLFTKGTGGTFGGSDKTGGAEMPTLQSCEPRIMSVYQTSGGYAALRFDIDLQTIVNNNMELLINSLEDTRVIKEKIRMNDVEFSTFSEEYAIYLRQYGAYFAVLNMESNGDGTAIATMLRLRKSASQPVPPEPYDYEVDYLESDGLAFIDTGIKASSNVEIQMYLADFFDEQNKNKGAFGGRNGSGSSEFGMMLDNSGNVIIGNGSQITLSPYTNYSPRCHVEIGGGVWKIGAATGTYTPSTYESNYNVYLFAMNNSGGAVKGKCKIGATQITDGVTTLDLIPVVKNGEGFMYDRISGQLFGNIGTGAFTWGNLPYDAEIEYLESTGTQWIDTGVNLREIVSMTADITITKNITTASDVFGAFYDNAAAPRFHLYINGSRKWSSPDTTKYTYSGITAGGTVNLNTHYSPTITALSAQASDVTIWVFARNNDHGSYIPIDGMRLFVYHITRGGVLVRDYIPVRKNGVGYMYDRVTDTLFGNDGTGDFVIGNDV